MKRYIVNQFDGNTFVVIDQKEEREICVCSNYDDWEDAEERAKNVVKLLNTSDTQERKPIWELISKTTSKELLKLLLVLPYFADIQKARFQLQENI